MKGLDYIFYSFNVMCNYILKELERKTNVKTDDLKIYLDLEPEKHNSYAFYDRTRNCIKINLNDYRRFILDEEEFTKELEGRRFDFLLAHELGHYIHEIHLGLKEFNFSDKGKIFNSYKSKEEDFADCFADWLINNKDTPERNKEMENILLKEGLLNYQKGE